MTVLVTDPRLDEGEREALAQALYLQLRDAHDALLDLRRPRESELPPGAKAAGATVLGAFVATVAAASLRHFFEILEERLRALEVSLQLDLGGRTVRVIARSAADFEAALAAAAELAAGGR